MVTATNIDLSGALEAHLSYKYRIENADLGEFMKISVSSDGGASFIDLKEYFGSESGTVSLSLSEQIPLTDQIKLRASCLVSANNEVCGWDNIKIEAVTTPPDELVVTINSPQARTYGASDFPLTYDVSLSQMGSAEYTLNDDFPNQMAGDEGGPSGTTHTSVENSLSNGSYTFQVFATDELGNTNDTQSVVFHVDMRGTGSRPRRTSVMPSFPGRTSRPELARTSYLNSSRSTFRNSTPMPWKRAGRTVVVGFHRKRSCISIGFSGPLSSRQSAGNSWREIRRTP